MLGIDLEASGILQIFEAAFDGDVKREVVAWTAGCDCLAIGFSAPAQELEADLPKMGLGAIE